MGFAFAALLSAHDPVTTKLTWTREISRIVLERCGRCHHDGGPAPMSLLNYEEARPWAKAIKEEVLERRMPPWGAVKGYGHFANDSSLSQEQIHLIADWVEGGAPEGDKSYLPVIPYLWPQARSEPSGREAVARVLRSGFNVTALRVDQLAEGASLKVAAALPDGTILPLVWVYNYRAKWKQTYVLANPLRLPAGTRIEQAPPGAGRVALIGEVMVAQTRSR